MYESATEQIKSEIQEIKSFRLATVSALFDDGCPKIQFFGEEKPSEKKHKVIKGTSYSDGDTVLVGIVNDGYVVLGTINYETSGDSGYLTSEEAKRLFAEIEHTHSGYASSTHSHDRLVSGNGNVKLVNYSGTSFSLDFSPTTNDTVTGYVTKWYQIYARTSTISTSDRNAKHDIESIPNKYVEFFKKLIPKRYKLNQSGFDRYHTGFISQDVEEALNASEVDTTEFAGFIKAQKEDGSEEYGLRYEEFIALNTMMIQKLLDITEEQGRRIEQLERRLLDEQDISN